MGSTRARVVGGVCTGQAFQVMHAHLTPHARNRPTNPGVAQQQSFPMTEEEYMLQLDAVASYLNLWCVQA